MPLNLPNDSEEAPGPAKQRQQIQRSQKSLELACLGGKKTGLGRWETPDGDSKLYWRLSGCCIPAQTLQGLREGDSLTDGQRRAGIN